MKCSILAASLAIATVSAYGDRWTNRKAESAKSTATGTGSTAGASATALAVGDWQVGGPTDFRGPCPMLNTLANHGFIPRDGKNITQEAAAFGLTTALNFEEAVAIQMFGHGVKANPAGGNSTFFDLEMLNVHNVLEHDASLSREDARFGNNHVFNQTIFSKTTLYWTADILTANMLANGKMARQLESKAFNPDYTFDNATENVSLGELAAPLLVFGSLENGTVPKAFVEFWFQQEKLPTELGWVKTAEAIGLLNIRAGSQKIARGAILTTAPSPLAPKIKVRDLHAGGEFWL